MRIDEDLKLENMISLGSSSSGKSHFIKEQAKIANPNRFIVFDMSIEWGNVLPDTVAISGIKNLYEYLVKNPIARIQYRPTFEKDEYPNFCKLVKAWASVDIGKLWCIVEEAGSLAKGAGKAQSGELEIITQGRKYGIKFIYITQSMSDGTKTILKNCSKIRFGRMDLLDIDYFQKRYGKDLGDKIRALKGKEGILFDIEKMKIIQFLPDTRSQKDKDADN